MLNKILFVFLALLLAPLYAETKDPNPFIPRVSKQISPRLALLEVKRINKPHIIKTSAVILSSDGIFVAALDPAVKDVKTLTVVYGKNRFEVRKRVYDPKGFVMAQVDDNGFLNSIKEMPKIQWSNKQNTLGDPRGIFFSQQYKENTSGRGTVADNVYDISIVPNIVEINTPTGSFSGPRVFQAMYNPTPIKLGYTEAESGAMFDPFDRFIGLGSKLSRPTQDPQYFVSADDIIEAWGNFSAKADSY